MMIALWILISLIITMEVYIFNLKKDYNILLGSYKQMGQVLVASDLIKQEEYNKYIKSKQEK